MLFDLLRGEKRWKMTEIFRKRVRVETSPREKCLSIPSSVRETCRTREISSIYRISDESEMEEIGYEEYFFLDAVCLIEWASLIPGLIPEDAVHINIEKDPQKGFDYRKISVEGI